MRMTILLMGVFAGSVAVAAQGAKPTPHHAGAHAMTKAEKIANAMTAAVRRLCQSSSVCVSGMTPLMFRIDCGSDAGAAMISAADEDSPSAQTLPMPR